MPRFENKDGRKERKILTAMITDPIFLGRVTSDWEPKSLTLASDWSNKIAGWCMDYFQRYGKAPGKEIESLFRGWADKITDKDMTKSIEQYLVSLSGEYETLSLESNTKFLFDQAGEYFEEVRATNLSESLRGKLAAGRVKEAVTEIEQFHRVDLGKGAPIKILNDEQRIREWFKTPQDPLVSYADGMGKFFGDFLRRDCLFAYVAGEKVGKTFFLLDMAWTALAQRRKVAFFQCGDLSEDQIIERILVRVSGKPSRPGNEGWPTVVKRPVNLERPVVGGDGESIVPLVEFKSRTFNGPMSEEEAVKATEKFRQKTIRSNKAYFQLSVHATKTIGVKGIRAVLDKLRIEEDWEADVVIIDYADILAPPPNSVKWEKRDQVNGNWEMLRTMSSELHCLVVTATQAKADSYTSRILTRKSFSEDKRKNAHVNGMVGINVTGEEKENQVVRLNWIVRRDGDYSPTRCCYVAQCLPLAEPAVLSVY